MRTPASACTSLRLISGLVPVLLAVAALADAAEPPPLTLAAAVAISQSEQPEVSEALARLAEARARLRQADALLLPRVLVGSSYTLTDQPALAFMDLINHRAYSQGIDANDPPTVDNLDLGAAIQVPLYTPGTWSGRLAAQHGAAAALSSRDAVCEALTLTTVQAFIGVHQARAHILAAAAGLQSSIANLAAAHVRNQAGTLSRAETLALEAAAAAARSDMAAADGGLELAGQALAAALGREGSITAVAAMPELPLPAAEPADERPELAQAREQAAAAEAGVDQARAQHLPQLGIFGGYNYDRGYRQVGEGHSWNLGLSMEWTIYAGGGTEAGVAEAKALASRAEVRRTALSIAHSRAAARTRYATITAQCAAAAAQRTAAEEAEHLQGERFSAGSATAADLAAAEAALAQARAAVADAEAGQRMTAADLRWQYGLPILPTTSGSRP